MRVESCRRRDQLAEVGGRRRTDREDVFCRGQSSARAKPRLTATGEEAIGGGADLVRHGLSHRPGWECVYVSRQ